MTRRILRTLLVCAAVGGGGIAAATLVPSWTPGIEGPAPVATLEAIPLGGVEQWVLIRGADRANPVLLYLHGGPGNAMIPFAREFSSHLEEHFVVVHWDQRGAGKSCSPRVPASSVNLEQILADTAELVLRLRERFGQERIYLLGHSWGSVLGVLTVKRHPDLFHAYVGLGQIVNLQRNEEISLRFVLERALKEGNEKALAELTGLRPPYRRFDDLLIQRGWLTHYRGDMLEGGGLLRGGVRLAMATEYTLREKVRYLGCLFASAERMWPEIESVDFPRLAPRLEVPVYFFTGRHDYNTPFELVEAYLAALEAPHKEIVWFERSAHNPHLEEPDRFQEELVRVLAETRPR